MMQITRVFAVCALTACCAIASMAESPRHLLTVSADYDSTAGALEKARLLNGSAGGYEPMNNLNWLPEAYDNLAAIGFKMIRLDHLVNDKFYRVVARDEARKLRFDFSRLDRVIKPMLHKGMTPLMCLTYCPGVLLPDGGDDGSVPKNLDEWKQIVKAYVQHYRDLGSTGWCWEVWNEPDIYRFFKGSGREYVALYVKTAEAIKETDPTARVGGAADAGVLSPTSKLGPLLDYVKGHPAVPLEFISYHKYGRSTLDEKPPYDLEWNVDEVNVQLASRGLPPRDIFVTEWNLTPVMDAGAGADADTHRAAAGAAARMYNALQRPALTKVFYFSLIEGYRSNRIFNGDLGLLTVNNHKKAIYNVFKMFASLGDTILRTEIKGPTSKSHSTYALATREASSQKIAILLWNYGDQAVPVQLTVDNLPYGPDGKNVQVTHYQVDADHANYYKDFRSGLRGYKPGPTEDLEPVERIVFAPTTTFSRAVTLLPFCVAEIILEPAGRVVMPGVLASRQAEQELDLAAAKPVSASSSLEKAGWGTNHLVNEITHSLPGTLGWSSAGHDTPNHSEWVCVDLGRAVRIDNIKLYPRDDQEAEGGGFPADFKIQASGDLNNWTDLVTRTEYGHGQKTLGVQAFVFTSRRCRYVRVYATRLGKVSSSPLEYRFQLAELEVYGKDN